MSADITWLDEGLFTCFIPNTDAGAVPYRQMIEEDGSPKVLSIHRNRVIAQLRRAGYTVAKARKPKPLNADDLLLLDQLNENGGEA